MAGLHFDKGAVLSALDAAWPGVVEEGLAAARDETDVAFVRVQDSLFPAMRVMILVYLDLSGAGRSPEFIGKAFGMLTGSFMSNLLGNTPNPEQLLQAFFDQAIGAINGEYAAVGSATVEFRGTPGGSA